MAQSGRGWIQSPSAPGKVIWGLCFDKTKNSLWSRISSLW